MSINAFIVTMRVLVFVGPVFAFWLTKRIALSLQRKDRDLLLHGRETGQVLRLPHGEFIEIHAPVGEAERAVLLSKVDVKPLPLPATADANGVALKGAGLQRVRARLSRWYYGDNVPLPSAAELAAAEAHHAHAAVADAHHPAPLPAAE